ncbi:MAG: hypothetical protein MN733_05575 [Nitrososphaera sp.]|nr:hypothetical protein [Nitrososphaera sp.]
MNNLFEIVKYITALLFAYLAFKLFDVIIGILAFFSGLFLLEYIGEHKLYTEEGRTAYAIEKRKAKASKKKIPSKAKLVLRVLGASTQNRSEDEYRDSSNYIETFSDDNISIKYERRTSSIKRNYEVEDPQEDDEYWAENLIIDEPGVNGPKRIFQWTDDKIYWKNGDIAAYVPGNWEAHLEKLYAQASEKERNGRKST